MYTCTPHTDEDGRGFKGSAFLSGFRTSTQIYHQAQTQIFGAKVI